jgi:catechol 2,3-dioxygenase-like lactoylglutathione lyase family enzyme
MSPESALAACPLIAFVPTTQPARARDFYQRTLGLRLTEDTPFALVLDAGGVMLRVTQVQNHTPAPFTILGWQVADIDEAVASLTRAGVEFLRYPGMNDSGPSPVWTSPAGAKIAWFHDPDRNVLSLTQFPATSSQVGAELS